MYAYQIEASRSVLLGPMFFLAIVFCLLGLFYSQQWKTRLVLFATTMINVLALFFTFTRTLWLMLAVCFIGILFFLSFRQKVAFSLGVVVTVLVTATIAFTVNPKLTTLAYKLIERRLTTSSKITGGDYSFETRLVEANSAMRRIKETPIGGQGIRTVIVSWHPVNQFTSMTTFIHIGYLGLVMKLGFPLTILFLSIVVGFSYCSIRDTLLYGSFLQKSPTLRVMSAGVAVITPALYVIIFMSGYFDQRYGVVMSAFLFACTAIVRANINADHHRSHVMMS
jgi:O-antigen ligase